MQPQIITPPRRRIWTPPPKEIVRCLPPGAGYSLGVGGRAGKKFGSTFDPATLALTGWWRASYSASPWVGTASAGASRSRNLTEATNPPAVGTAQNGLAPADFDGLNDQMRNELTLDDYVNASATSLWVLFRADTAAADDALPYENPGLIALSGAGYLVVGYSDAGVRGAVYDGAYKQLSVAASTGAYHLAQMKHDGTNLKLRVDSGAWSSVAAGAIALLTTTTVLFGTNYAQTDFFDGRVLEFGLADSVFSDGTFDDIKSYVNARYALAL